MDKRVLAHLQREGMVSLMNDTKWRELATRLEAVARGELPVRVKFVLDEAPFGFAPQDWDWFKRGDAEVVEWIEIDPIVATFRGRRVPDHLEDFTAEVVDALRSVGVPYSSEGRGFTVWAHVRPGAQPRFE